MCVPMDKLTKQQLSMVEETIEMAKKSDLLEADLMNNQSLDFLVQKEQKPYL